MVIEFYHKLPSEKAERWGGGWNWRLGLDIGKHQINIALVVFLVVIYWGEKNG